MLDRQNTEISALLNLLLRRYKKLDIKHNYCIIFSDLNASKQLLFPEFNIHKATEIFFKAAEITVFLDMYMIF